MDPFLIFPNEIIIQICEELNTSDLLSTAEASSKVYQVCSDIIKERKEIYEEEHRIIRNIREKPKVTFRKNAFGGIVQITIINKENTYKIKQYISMYSNPFKVNWILPKISPSVSPDKHLRKIEISKSELDISELVQNLNKLNYNIVI